MNVIHRDPRCDCGRRHERFTIEVDGELVSVLGCPVCMAKPDPETGITGIQAISEIARVVRRSHPDSEAVRAPRGDDGETPG